jgi:hypothetical protein
MRDIMRKLSPFKAVSHALNSVWSFRAAALRICLLWAPIMLVAGFFEYFTAVQHPELQVLSPPPFIQLASGIVSIIAVCSMAVSWHRFILRDEPAGGLRLDIHVLRYAGATVLIMLGMVIPALFFVALATSLPPIMAILGLPAIVLAGGLVTRLSVKLPAVALGNHSFTFKDAWAASAGNFWPCVGVFLLNAAILLAIMLVLAMLADLSAQVSESLSLAFQLLVAVAFQIFYSLFNASVFTSLYGFFVERRDF